MHRDIFLLMNLIAVRLENDILKKIVFKSTNTDTKLRDTLYESLRNIASKWKIIYLHKLF